MTWLVRLEEQARERARAGLRRELRPRPEDDGLVDLAGNDYLGLARHPDVLAASGAALKAYGLGATASRLVRGSTEVHAALERALADLLGCEAALVYSSGYLANLGAVRALVALGGPVASDAHNHASLVDGCRLAAGRTGRSAAVYRHADPDALDEALAGAADGAEGVAVTESVFSVHGDLAPLGALHAVARRHGAVLLVDDAHAVGLLGDDGDGGGDGDGDGDGDGGGGAGGGGGGVAAAGLSGRPDVVVTATLSKAIGAAGGVVAGPAAFIAHLVETSRTFIYDTGLPPAVAAGALTAVELIRSGYGRAARAELAERAALAHAVLDTPDRTVGRPAGGVLSVPAPGPDEVLAWAAACRARGVAVGCFRPPSTPDGESRLRLTISTGVARADFERALQTILVTAPAAVSIR